MRPNDPHRNEARLAASRPRRATAHLLIAAMVLGLGIAGLVLIPSTQAEAQCQGAGNAFVWGPAWGHERTQLAATCNDNHWYAGEVADKKTDGACVDQYYRDEPGNAWTFEGRSCTINDWVHFDYQFADHDSQFRLCKHTGGCTTVANNWGF